ncbi:hypothetical protein EDD16DRAFT_1204611 [Pisolithus croceorrhizus]|nr:hypothetical protein EDD16DRAFT_1204611 [Pisolithus croceorrhizus]KAI6159685.1 hypothetical protein EDD17DRAFT_887755 [Pisolithus thermaeus]
MWVDEAQFLVTFTGFPSLRVAVAADSIFMRTRTAKHSTHSASDNYARQELSEDDCEEVVLQLQVRPCHPCLFAGEGTSGANYKGKLSALASGGARVLASQDPWSGQKRSPAVLGFPQLLRPSMQGGVISPYWGPSRSLMATQAAIHGPRSMQLLATNTVTVRKFSLLFQAHTQA